MGKNGYFEVFLGVFGYLLHIKKSIFKGFGQSPLFF